MNFDVVLEQVIELLRQKGRVSYRALKVRFSLDDDLLEALKDEIIYAQKVATDEDGRVLIWIGEKKHQPKIDFSSPSLNQQPIPHSTEYPESDTAELRQLTVMFCDLVDSTTLSSQLDAEEFREIVRSYQQTSAKTIKPYEGYIAQYLGDGILVYFGYPQAHEDSAQRAVYAGLKITQAIETLNSHLERDKGIRLAVRIGIHSGMVVVGEIGGSSSRHEKLAFGETPNIAARLQSLARPNQVLVSESTRRLVLGTFDLENLGAHELKGISEPMSVYDVNEVQSDLSRFEARTTIGLTPLVGREEEMSLLLRRWNIAKEGEGQIILLSGEAGIGKSRLAQTLLNTVFQEQHTRLRYQSSPYHINTAFYPLVVQLERAAQLTRDDSPEQKLNKLEELLSQSSTNVHEIAPLFAAMLSIPINDRYPPLNLSPQRQKAYTIEALVDQMESLALDNPALMVFEDAHWSDPTSIEVLDAVVYRALDMQVLVVITYRPEFEAPWTKDSHVTTLTLNRLSRSQCTTMVEMITADKTIPNTILDQIASKTDGVPLFVEELTRSFLETEFIKEKHNRYELKDPLPPLAIPSTLKDSLMSRLDRLASVKEIAQIGAVIGREFSYELMSILAPFQESELESALNKFVDSNLVFRRGQPPKANYFFKHALVQEAAYGSLLKTKRRLLHARIAKILEERFPETAENEPELLAHHYTAANNTQQAIPFWMKAGSEAYLRSANQESISHYQQALSLLQKLPEGTERTHQELICFMSLGLAYSAVLGYTVVEVEQSFGKAYKLCQELGDNNPQLFPVLYGLFQFNWVSGKFEMAKQFGEQMLEIAKSVDDSSLRLVAEGSLGCVCWHIALLEEAEQHLNKALSLYERDLHAPLIAEYNQDFGVMSLTFLGVGLCWLGYNDKAVKAVKNGKSMADDLKHPISQCTLLAIGLQVFIMSGDLDTVLSWAEECIALSAEQGFPHWLAMAKMDKGWALGKKGHTKDGLDYIRQGIKEFDAIGAGVYLGGWRCYLAETQLAHGQPGEALVSADKGLALVRQKAEYTVESYAFSCKGKSLVALKRSEEAEVCFRQAIESARKRNMKLFELRAATGLARLWKKKGRIDEARDLLSPIYYWFTEGFDTYNLLEAKALLDELE